MVVRFVTTLNGISIAYVMGLVNALLAILLSFGVNMNETQTASIVTFVNASFVLLAHVSHRNGEIHPTPASITPGEPTVTVVSTPAPTPPEA